MKTKKIFSFCAFLFLFWCQQVSAQLIQPQFQHLTLDDGLSDFTTYAIARDHSGFTWIATRNGLDRFDGYSVKTYFHQPADSNSLSSNVIFSLCADRAGELWVGCDNGIARYDERCDCFHQISLDEKIITDKKVNVICEDHDGILWFGMANGLKKWNAAANKMERVFFIGDPSGSARQPAITGIIPDEENNLWITGSFGIIRFNTNTSQSFKISNEGKEFDVTDVRSAAISDRYHVWLATSSGTLAEVSDDGVATIFDLRKFFQGQNPETRPMIFDHDGNLWMATRSSGLIHFNPATQQVALLQQDPADSRSLKSNKITNLFLDRQNILWLTFDGGVSRFSLNAKPFYSFSQKYFSKETTLAGNWVRCFEEDNHGNIWIGTVYGISIFNKSTGTFLRNIYKDSIHHSTIPDNSIRALSKDAEGNIWIGTAAGIARYNAASGNFTHMKIVPGKNCYAKPDFIMSIICEPDGDVYAASGCGIYKYDKMLNDFVTFENDSVLSILNQSSVRSFFKDHEGKFWIALDHKGVASWNAGKNEVQTFFTNYDRKDWLTADMINAINEDSEGNIWMTSRNGLFCYHPSTNTFQNFTVKDGLPNNFCGSILMDVHRRIWFTNGAGLTCYDLSEKTFRTYNKSDGLQSNQFNDQQGFISHDGFFFLGGLEGFSFFHPDSIHSAKNGPPVYLQSLRIMDKEFISDYLINDSPSFILPHDQNFISFKMTAINYDHPEKNLYAYYLEGLESKWNYTGTNRLGNYTGLRPGKYVLHIKAGNEDGVWSEKEFKLPIRINLAYWQTWWFITLCFLTVAGILYALYRYRLNHILKLQHVRNRIARDLHDDVGASLSSIRMYSEAIRSQVKEKIPLADIILQKISDNSKEVVENMSDIVWAINPKNDSLQSIEDRMRSFAIDICAAKNITLQFDFPENGTLKIPMELRKNIFLIFKEAMNNATKYSGCTDILIKLHHTSQYLEMEILDDGKGFDEEKIKRGNGLLNMGKRAEEIHGKMMIQSEEGKGTTIRVTAHLP